MFDTRQTCCSPNPPNPHTITGVGRARPAFGDAFPAVGNFRAVWPEKYLYFSILWMKKVKCNIEKSNI